MNKFCEFDLIMMIIELISFNLSLLINFISYFIFLLILSLFILLFINHLIINIYLLLIV